MMDEEGGRGPDYVQERTGHTLRYFSHGSSHGMTLHSNNHNLAPMITHCAQVYFRFGDHFDKIWCFVTSLSKFDLILGMPWLE